MCHCAVAKKMNKKCAVGKKEKIQKGQQRVSAYPLSRFNMVCLCLPVCQNGLLFLSVRPLLSGCTVVLYCPKIVDKFLGYKFRLIYVFSYLICRTYKLRFPIDVLGQGFGSLGLNVNVYCCIVLLLF